MQQNQNKNNIILNTKQPGSKKIIITVIIVILLIAGLIIGGYIWWQSTQKNSSNSASEVDSDTSSPVSISQNILDNKFGFLGGGAEDNGEAIINTGAGWVRPHPGAFVWDMMQQQKTDTIDFTDSDQEVKNFQAAKLGTLATIWPFAEWDQLTSADLVNCKVSENDEFLPNNDQKDRGAYLPLHRCNPQDWQAYRTWVKAIVERYDGDGTNDMPGLKLPIKYWEVMNEPDLTWQSDLGEGRLTFYKQGPTEYSELLKQTYTAIKEADPTAQVLIAGAAGGDQQFIGFYQKVFADTPDIKDYFDIGNVHCISNDQETHDFNVGVYKNAMINAKIDKPIWVTEAEAMYGQSAEENFNSTKTSTANALAAGAQKIFYTRYHFDDMRTDMSEKTNSGSYPSSQKYKEMFESF
ncbi:MAG: hypothetical protein PVI21_06305 [Candidatus Woesebacteria bacterium]